MLLCQSYKFSKSDTMANNYEGSRRTFLTQRTKKQGQHSATHDKMQQTSTHATNYQQVACTSNILSYMHGKKDVAATALLVNAGGNLEMR